MNIFEKYRGWFSKKTAPTNDTPFIIPTQSTLQNTVKSLEKRALDAGQAGDADGFASLVTELNSAINNVKIGTSHPFERQKIEVDASYELAGKALHQMNDENERAALINEQKALLKPDLNEALSPQELELKEIQREKQRLNSELKDAQSRKAMAERQNGANGVQGKVNAITGYVIAVFIGLLEVAASAGPFMNLGNGMMAGLGMLMAVGVSTMLVITSHLGGRALAKKNIVMARAWLVIGGLLLVAVISLRFGTGEAGFLENTIISAILIALYAASWLLALRYWKAWALTLHQREVYKLVKKLEALQKREDKITSALNNKKARHDTKILKDLNKQKDQITDEHRNLDLAVKKLEHDRSTSEVLLSQLRENALTKIRQAFDQGVRIAKNGMYSLALVSTLLLGACDTQDATTHEHVTVVDISSSAEDSLNTPQVIYDYHTQITALLSKEGWYGKAVTLRLMVVGDISGGENLRTISLPAPPILPLRNPKRRAKQVDAFLTDLEAGLALTLSMRGSANKTQLNSGLTNALNALAASNADTKTLLLLSDMVHDGYEVNFHHYKNDPRGLLENFEDLNAKLDQTGKLDTLGNITVTIAYGGQKNKALFLAASEFWKRRIRANNDSVSVSIARTLH